MTIDAKPTAPPLEEVVATSASAETSEGKQPPLVASAPPADTTTSRGATELDLVFCCDCTGSMSAYLRSAQQNIISISQAINDAVGSKLEVRYGLVKYRDHPPQDKTFITEVFPFTKKIQVMKKFVDTMEASGGGDGPEAVAAALHEVDVMEWRPNSVKVCVLIADAPPHGLGESGDGFPNGCPLGHDPINVCRSLAAKGVVVYAVGVEPILSTSYKNARDFMMCVAKITDGKFLPLGKADILSKVIVNSCLENIDMTDFWSSLEQEVEKETAGQKVTAEAKVELLERKMKERAATRDCRQVEVENPYMADYDFSNVNRMMAATSLKSAVPMLEYSRNADVGRKVAEFKWSKQEFSAPACSAVTDEQCERVAFRAKKKAGLF